MPKHLRIPPFEDVRPWSAIAIAEEDAKSQDQMWKNEPSQLDAYTTRLKQVRLLTRQARQNPALLGLAQRLRACQPRARCCSGSCPECGRLLQRWFVRKSGKLLATERDIASEQLVAVSIVPPRSMVQPGKLQTLSIANFHRRLKYALIAAGIKFAIGGIDISFNEDRRGKYSPFWSPHLYVITTVTNKKVCKRLKKHFRRCDTVRRPIKVTTFYNNARRRSYALKTHFGRRIGYDEAKQYKGKLRRCRNTGYDKIRSADRLELLLFLDTIGLANRPFFLGCKPHVSLKSVKLLRTG